MFPMPPMPPTPGTLKMAADVLARRGSIPEAQAWLRGQADTLERTALECADRGDVAGGDRRMDLAHICRVAAAWLPHRN